MDFTLRLGPVPIHWVARIENVSPTGFTDRQVKGPFEYWVHTHTFVPIDEDSTAVIDTIEYQYRRNFWQKIIGFGMAMSLPLLFAFRGWKTRKLLES